MKKKTMKIILATILVWLAFITMSKVKATYYHWYDSDTIDNIKTGDTVEIRKASSKSIAAPGKGTPEKIAWDDNDLSTYSINGYYFIVKGLSEGQDNVTLKFKNGDIKITLIIRAIEEESNRQIDAAQNGGNIDYSKDGKSVINNKALYYIANQQTEKLSNSEIKKMMAAMGEDQEAYKMLKAIQEGKNPADLANDAKKKLDEIVEKTEVQRDKAAEEEDLKKYENTALKTPTSENRTDVHYVDVLSNPNAYGKVEDQTGEGRGAIKTAGRILGAIQNIGIIAAVIIAAVIGLKYILGSAEERAEYKQTLVPYVIGLVLLVTIPTVANILYKVGTSFKA